MKHNIILVEDDEKSALWTQSFLEDCDFNVECFTLASDAIATLKVKKFDLLLLDLNLPDSNGFEILKAIRNQVFIPVIVLSAESDTKTKVQAFKLGANDYMVKPYDLEELEARIWATFGKNSMIASVEDIFAVKNNSIIFKEESLLLTQVEFDIFKILINNRNSTVSRESLCTKLSSISSQRSLDHHIKNIRKKIDDNASNPKYLKTEYGVGYLLTF